MPKGQQVHSDLVNLGVVYQLDHNLNRLKVRTRGCRFRDVVAARVCSSSLVHPSAMTHLLIEWSISNYQAVLTLTMITPENPPQYIHASGASIFSRDCYRFPHTIIKNWVHDRFSHTNINHGDHVTIALRARLQPHTLCLSVCLRTCVPAYACV